MPYFDLTLWFYSDNSTDKLSLMKEFLECFENKTNKIFPIKLKLGRKKIIIESLNSFLQHLQNEDLKNFYSEETQLKDGFIDVWLVEKYINIRVHFEVNLFFLEENYFFNYVLELVEKYNERGYFQNYSGISTSGTGYARIRPGRNYNILGEDSILDIINKNSNTKELNELDKQILPTNAKKYNLKNVIVLDWGLDISSQSIELLKQTLTNKNRWLKSIELGFVAGGWNIHGDTEVWLSANSKPLYDFDIYCPASDIGYIIVKELKNNGDLLKEINDKTHKMNIKDIDKVGIIANSRADAVNLKSLLSHSISNIYYRDSENKLLLWNPFPEGNFWSDD